MQSTIHPARKRGHLSRHERQRVARAEAFSRRTPAGVCSEVSVKLGQDELDLIERLVRRDRTAVSSALLAIAGVGAGEAIRVAVLARVSEAACEAQAEGAISAERGGQIARHVSRAQDARDRAPREEDVLSERFEARLTVMSVEASPVVVEVLRFEDLPPGSLASRRAVVRWSDRSEGEGLRWYSDEVKFSEGDLLGKSREQLRSLHFRRDRCDARSHVYE